MERLQRPSPEVVFLRRKGKIFPVLISVPEAPRREAGSGDAGISCFNTELNSQSGTTPLASGTASRIYIRLNHLGDFCAQNETFYSAMQPATPNWKTKQVSSDLIETLGDFNRRTKTRPITSVVIGVSALSLPTTQETTWCCQAVCSHNLTTAAPWCGKRILWTQPKVERGQTRKTKQGNLSQNN